MRNSPLGPLALVESLNTSLTLIVHFLFVPTGSCGLAAFFLLLAWL